MNSYAGSFAGNVLMSVLLMGCGRTVCCCRHADGFEHDVMKNPTAGGKSSSPGPLAVKLVEGVPTVFPRDSGLVDSSEDLLQTVYDNGPVEVCFH